MRLLRDCARLGDAGHIPCGGYQPQGTGDQRFGAGNATETTGVVAHARTGAAKRLRCSPASSAPIANRRLVPVPPENRSRSGVDRHGDDRRHCHQRRKPGRVLRNEERQPQRWRGCAWCSADGTVLDTRDTNQFSGAFVERATPVWCTVSLHWGHAVRANESLAARIRPSSG